MGLNSIAITALLGLVGKKNATAKRVATAFSSVSLPLGLGCVSLAAAAFALCGAPVAALALATLGGLPILYKSTQLLFRKEIAQMQARQHLEQGVEE